MAYTPPAVPDAPSLSRPSTFEVDTSAFLAWMAALAQSGIDGDGFLLTSDIIGTVSQSGGTPTGGIIERGSNANGEYVKFADGTLECWRVASVDVTTTGTQAFTTPAAFVSDSTGSIHPATVSHVSGPNDALRLNNIRLCRTANNAWNFRLVTAGTSVDPSSTDEQVILRAIGRWF